MFTIATRYHFDSAHKLNNYKGKCAHLHGHRWVVEVFVCGDELDATGMLVDFGVIKGKLKILCDRLDHKFLNDMLDFNPTAENLAKWFYKKLKVVTKVRIYESPDSFAEYQEC